MKAILGGLLSSFNQPVFSSKVIDKAHKQNNSYAKGDVYAVNFTNNQCPQTLEEAGPGIA